jgi:hypothetical protein
MIRARSAAVAALALACAPPDEPVQPEPRVLRFSAAHPELTLRLTAADERALARVRIDPQGPDWGAFTITDKTLPRRVGPGEPAELHLRVDPDHFAADHHEHRPGGATLTLRADQTPVRVPLQFIPAGQDPAIWPRLAALAALAALAVARRWPWLTAVPALVFLAVAPFGAGLCPDLLAVPATTADVLQCADGRGGVALQLLAHPDALGLALAAACLAGLHVASWRAVALALFAALVAHASLDPQQIVHTQAGLRWGVLMQPLGSAALAVAALVHVRSDPPLPRLATLGLAALLTTLLLGGSDLGRIGLPHAAAVAIGVIAWLGKLALIAWGLRRLPAPTWLARLVLPLSAAQLLATAATVAMASLWP